MPTLFAIHEVEDGKHWAAAWQKKPGSRHDMFARIGVTCRTFRDPDNPNVTGVLVEVPDLKAFQEFMATDEAAQAMKEDRLKVDTLRMLHEFTP